MAVSSIRPRHALALAIVAALLLTLLPQGSPAQAIDDRSISEIRKGFQRRINSARDKRDLRILKVNDVIQTWAQKHAEDMAEAKTEYHDANLLIEVNKVTKTVWWYGENVGRTTSDTAAKTLHKMFMNSSGHRANILKSRATHMGIGVAKRGNYVYVVERFVDLKL
jgi:uncharacterized protein YkwD